MQIRSPSCCLNPSGKHENYKSHHIACDMCGSRQFPTLHGLLHRRWRTPIINRIPLARLCSRHAKGMELHPSDHQITFVHHRATGRASIALSRVTLVHTAPGMGRYGACRGSNSCMRLLTLCASRPARPPTPESRARTHAESRTLRRRALTLPYHAHWFHSHSTRPTPATGSTGVVHERHLLSKPATAGWPPRRCPHVCRASDAAPARLL